MCDFNPFLPSHCLCLSVDPSLLPPPSARSSSSALSLTVSPLLNPLYCVLLTSWRHRSTFITSFRRSRNIINTRFQRFQAAAILLRTTPFSSLWSSTGKSEACSDLFPPLSMLDKVSRRMSAMEADCSTQLPADFTQNYLPKHIHLHWAGFCKGRYCRRR